MSRGRSACPTPQALSRAFSAGPDRAPPAHVAGCPSCGAEWAALRRLVDLGRALPEGQPTDERRADVRTALLTAAPGAARPPAARRRLVWAAAAGVLLAAAVSGVLLLAGRSTPEAGCSAPAASRRAAVHARGEAAFAVLGGQPDEIVRLSEGTLTLDVAPLRPGERVRVVTGDAEVEVRGTVFDVAATRDRLVAVRVLHGRVDVRPASAQAVVLGPGERWNAPTAIARAPESTAPRAAPGEPPAAPAAAAAPVAVPVSTAPPPEAPAVPPAAAAPPQPPLPRREPPASSGSPGRPPAVPEPPPPPATADDDHGPAIAAPAVPSPAAAAFGEGWTAVRAGRFVDAAEAFGRAAALAGPEPLAEDAAFWRAVALGRAGWSAAAGQALLGFLERHPRSPRAGEAAVMLGWILLEAGDVAGAAARFRAAVDDPVPAVRNGAREGLRTAEDAGGE